MNEIKNQAKNQFQFEAENGKTKACHDEGQKPGFGFPSRNSEHNLYNYRKSLAHFARYKLLSIFLINNKYLFQSFKILLNLQILNKYHN